MVRAQCAATTVHDIVRPMDSSWERPARVPEAVGRTSIVKLSPAAKMYTK